MTIAPGIGEVAWTYSGAWIAHDDLLLLGERDEPSIIYGQSLYQSGDKCAVRHEAFLAVQQGVDKGEGTKSDHDHPTAQTKPFQSLGSGREPASNGRCYEAPGAI